MAQRIVAFARWCAVLAIVQMLAACSKDEKMSEEWCEEMMLLPNASWTDEQTELFARDCLYNDEQ